MPATSSAITPSAATPAHNNLRPDCDVETRPSANSDVIFILADDTARARPDEPLRFMASIKDDEPTAFIASVGGDCATSNGRHAAHNRRPSSRNEPPDPTGWISFMQPLQNHSGVTFCEALSAAAALLDLISEFCSKLNATLQ